MWLICIKIPKLITYDDLMSMELAFYDSDLSHTQDSVPQEKVMTCYKSQLLPNNCPDVILLVIVYTPGSGGHKRGTHT